jgi:alpha-L-arabinofuranosidase
MFAQATGNGAKMLPISNLTNANLDVWATVDNSGTVHVVVINKDEAQTGSVQISVPGYNNAVALPLTAPSYTATNGIRYAGQTFDGSTNGTIQGSQVTQTITPNNGVFSISVPTTSAVLLNLTQ